MSMSRNALCLWTAAGLTVLALGFALVRYRTVGRQTHLPTGHDNFKVTLLIRGQSKGDARLLSACPLDFHRQHIYGEEYRSEELYPKLSESKTGDKRHLQWSQRALAPKGPLEARYQFLCSIDVRRPTASMTRLHQLVHAAPPPNQWTTASPGIDPAHADITAMALDLTAGLTRPMDQARALYQFVARRIGKEPSAGASASAHACLNRGRGDALAKSRLLAALCRSRGIPARLVNGLILNTAEQKAHVWVEAWVEGSWMPLCPFHQHCGKVPPTYLVFGHGDLALVRGHNVAGLDYAFLVEEYHPAAPSSEASPLRRFFERISLFTLAPAEYRLVEFLLLLPLAALIICIYRNVIGLPSFGTFAPALIGLAFRESESLPGILVFVSILLVGWCLRRALDRFHLLQVPRSAFMLSLVVVLLVGLVLAANYQDLAATRYVSLFPMVILTGMIERFWTQETEDGTWSSFKVLLSTLLIAGSISLLLGIPPLVRHLVNYPETLGVIMAGQLLIGRYTGYRLSELVRFRDFLRQEEVKTLQARVRIDEDLVREKAA